MEKRGQKVSETLTPELLVRDMGVVCRTPVVFSFISRMVSSKAPEKPPQKVNASSGRCGRTITQHKPLQKVLKCSQNANQVGSVEF